MSFDGDLTSINEREKKVLEIYKSFNSKNKHKMIAIPVCKIPR